MVNIPFKSDTFFHDVAMLCPAGKSETPLCDTSTLNEALKQGEYRIVCEVSNLSTTMGNLNRKELLAAVFKIQ